MIDKQKLYVADLFTPLVTSLALPEIFPSPFNHTPHPLAQCAAKDLQRRLRTEFDCIHDFHRPEGGKMLGVLVVKNAREELGYLGACSGMLGGRWLQPGFVPPAFDLAAREQFMMAAEARLSALVAHVQAMQNSPEIAAARAQWQAVVQQSCADVEALKGDHLKRKLQRRQIRDGGTQVVRQVAAASEVDNGASLIDSAKVAELSRQSSDDRRQMRERRRYWRQRCETAKQCLQRIERRITQLKRRHKNYSQALQRRVFKGYLLRDTQGQTTSMGDLFGDRLPPAGAGDCAAVKLLHAASRQDLTPLCLAEFWWGHSPASGIRVAGQWYPACRSKCRPILPFMLSGLHVAAAAHEVVQHFDTVQPEVVYADQHLFVLCKPAGMLSVAGLEIVDSVERRLIAREGFDHQPLVHRLDQATSGLLIAARTRQAHKLLQQQFANRQVQKTYIALLDGKLTQTAGKILLPLRVDLDDRPRQVVCSQYGKQAATQYRVLTFERRYTRVEFKPITGRTHQLRVHAAHPAGLNCPIVGDELYGLPADRMMLHAERLQFRHPFHGQLLSFTDPAPF